LALVVVVVVLALWLDKEKTEEIEKEDIMKKKKEEERRALCFHVNISGLNKSTPQRGPMHQGPWRDSHTLYCACR